MTIAIEEFDGSKPLVSIESYSVKSSFRDV